MSLTQTRRWFLKAITMIVAVGNRDRIIPKSDLTHQGVPIYFDPELGREYTGYRFGREGFQWIRTGIRNGKWFEEVISEKEIQTYNSRTETMGDSWKTVCDSDQGLEGRTDRDVVGSWNWWFDSNGYYKPSIRDRRKRAGRKRLPE